MNDALPGTQNVPDLTEIYNFYFYTASGRKYTDSHAFHLTLIHQLDQLVDLLSGKGEVQTNGFSRLDLVNSCFKFIEIYNAAIGQYRNTPLKALIVHDLKGIMTNAVMALTLTTKDKFKDDSFIISKIESFKSFINLIMIVLFVPEDWIKDEVIIEMLQNTFDEKIDLEVDFNEELLHRFRELIWPIHTILLNAKEKGAKHVRLSIIESEEQITVEISDDIDNYKGIEGDELIQNINTNINSPPKKILGMELLTWEVIDQVAKIISEMFYREGDDLEHIFNVVVPLVSLHVRKMMNELKDDLPEHFKVALDTKVGDTDQLSGQGGLSISRTFVEMFNGTLTCVPYDTSKPLRSANPKGYCKTIRICLPNTSRYAPVIS